MVPSMVSLVGSMCSERLGHNDGKEADASILDVEYWPDCNELVSAPDILPGEEAAEGVEGTVVLMTLKDKDHSMRLHTAVRRRDLPSSMVAVVHSSQ